ncbi:MAG: hypothetical protein ACM3WU_04880 [Bacillota bacterium]
MRILGSAVNVTGKHSLDIAESVQESMRIWREYRAAGAPAVPAIDSETQGDRLTISQEALEAYKAESQPLCQAAPVSVDAELFGLTPQDRILIMVLEKALGIRIKTTDDPLETTAESGKSIAARVQEIMEAAERQAEALKQAATPPDRAGWDYIFKNRESQIETKSPSFEASALVRTEDGQEITFVFELDGNGKEDEISSLAGDRGFLALDRNDLRIWAKEGSGKNRLFALGQKGVGAIYVGNIAARFNAKDAAVEPPSTQT